MNRENARQYIPLLEALADGELQLNHNTEAEPDWRDHPVSAFGYPPQFYRRRPKPREVWVVVNKFGVPVQVWATEHGARDAVSSCAGATYFRAVEVTQ